MSQEFQDPDCPHSVPYATPGISASGAGCSLVLAGGQPCSASLWQGPAAPPPRTGVPWASEQLSMEGRGWTGWARAGGTEAPGVAGSPQPLPSELPWPLSAASQQILEFLTPLRSDLRASRFCLLRAILSPHFRLGSWPHPTPLAGPLAPRGGWRGRRSISDPGPCLKPCPRPFWAWACSSAGPSTRAVNPTWSLALWPHLLSPRCHCRGAVGWGGAGDDEVVSEGRS